MRDAVAGSSETLCDPLQDSARFTFKLHVLLRHAHFDVRLVITALTCRLLLLHQQTKAITSPCHTKLTSSLTKELQKAYNINSCPHFIFIRTASTLPHHLFIPNYTPISCFRITCLFKSFLKICSQFQSHLHFLQCKHEQSKPK
jgi:hypothetical protein